MKITNNKGQNISSIDEWLALAPPQNPQVQWVDGRSAKELAKAFFPVPGAVTIPSELSSLLSSSDALGSLELSEGEAEAVVKFDCIQGKTRHCDLLARATSHIRKASISIDAKADEKFNDVVRVAYNVPPPKGGRPSQKPERIKLLTKAVLGRDVEESGDFRYQLLYGTAATLSAAKKHEATAAVFVVYEFVTVLTAKHKRNANDLDNFVCALSRGLITHVTAGQLFGPVRVPGNENIPGDVDLFIGKAVRNIRLAG